MVSTSVEIHIYDKNFTYTNNVMAKRGETIIILGMTPLKRA